MTKRKKPPTWIFKIVDGTEMPLDAIEVEFRILRLAAWESSSDDRLLRQSGEQRLRQAAARVVHSKMVESGRVVATAATAETVIDQRTKRARRYAKILRDVDFSFPVRGKHWHQAALKILLAKGQDVTDAWLRNHAAALREHFNELEKPSNP